MFSISNCSKYIAVVLKHSVFLKEVESGITTVLLETSSLPTFSTKNVMFSADGSCIFLCCYRYNLDLESCFELKFWHPHLDDAEDNLVPLWTQTVRSNQFGFASEFAISHDNTMIAMFHNNLK